MPVWLASSSRVRRLLKVLERAQYSEKYVEEGELDYALSVVTLKPSDLKVRLHSPNCYHRGVHILSKRHSRAVEAGVPFYRQ
jgi:hypothetical protein